MIETIAVVHPITAIALTGDTISTLLFVGCGGQVSSHRTLYGDDRTITTSVTLFLSDTVHGIKVYCDSMFHTLRSSSKSSRYRRNEDVVVVYGGKAIGFVCPILSSSSNDDGSIRLDVENILENLDDMVLDVELLTTDVYNHPDCRTLLIGYAHNFVDLIDVFTSQNTTKYHRRFRVQCPELSVLFSMTIDVNDPNHECHRISISSGTAFGKIIVWSIELSTIHPAAIHTNANQVKGEISQERKILPLPTVRTLLSWTEHEGVIFKMRWSTNRQRLASVSDDRTVRIWDMTCVPCKSVFVGWGHVSRLWDVLFLPGPQGVDTWLATSSEDGTIRIWDITKGMENEAIAVLRGHSSHIWCMAALRVSPMDGSRHMGENILSSTPSSSSSSSSSTTTISLAIPTTTTTTTAANEKSSVDNPYITTTSTSTLLTTKPTTRMMSSYTESTRIILFSGGNDGSIKSWPLLPHIIASAFNTDSSLIGVPVPMAPISISPLQSQPRQSSVASKTSVDSVVLPCITTSVGDGMIALESTSPSAPITTIVTLPTTPINEINISINEINIPINEINAPIDNDEIIKVPVSSRRSNAVRDLSYPNQNNQNNPTLTSFLLSCI